jgi:hypothetical protein
MPKIQGLMTGRTGGDRLGWLKTVGLVFAVFALALGSAMAVANAAECVSACRAKHNQCRIDTKGASTACDQQLNQCVHACMATKKS